MVAMAAVSPDVELQPLTATPSNKRFSLAVPGFSALCCSCCCNVVLTVAVGYLLWYALFRPSTVAVCMQDYHANEARARANVSAVVAQEALEGASQERIDCYLAMYKKITFDLANYSEDPVAFQRLGAV